MNWNYSESFAGIGAWGKAIKRVSERHEDTCELKWFAEIDKYAINSFCAIHDEPESKNIVDITKDINVEEVDVFFYSPPCQTFSIAGKREGTDVDKGNLFYNALDKLKKSNPKYAIMENVKGLPSGDTKEDFNNMIFALDDAGYFSYWKVLNSKDYGIPQNRERVFIVSIRKDIYDQGKRFEFPKEIKLEKTLFDMLEEEVDEKYYIKQEILDKLEYELDNEKESIGDYRYDEGFRIRSNDILPCLMSSTTLNSISGSPLHINSATKKGYEVANVGDGITLDFPKSKTRRGRVGNKVSQTLTTSCNVGVYNGNTIRQITPLESFKLQGFTEKDYNKAVKSYKNTFNNKYHNQMYKQAGNSITVNVIEEILENLLYDRKQIGNQLSMF